MEMQKDTASNGAFRARSGRTVRVEGNGTVVFDHANGYLSPESAMDAEEFFQAKHDEELGRWRWPENPDWIAIEQPDRTPEGRTVKVVNERTLDYFHANERVMMTDGGSSAHRAARAYFEVHPDRKPWWEAHPGEVWLLNIDHKNASDEVAWQVATSTEFSRLGIALNMRDERITSARRIWPEEAA